MPHPFPDHMGDRLVGQRANLRIIGRAQRQGRSRIDDDRGLRVVAGQTFDLQQFQLIARDVRPNPPAINEPEPRRRESDGLFFAGDLDQRIFQQPFSWRSLGVDIRGRSYTLRVNYRTRIKSAHRQIGC
jgi:hypothetical protein